MIYCLATWPQIDAFHNLLSRCDAFDVALPGAHVNAGRIFQGIYVHIIN